jgi:hypothetical protein
MQIMPRVRLPTAAWPFAAAELDRQSFPLPDPERVAERLPFAEGNVEVLRSSEQEMPAPLSLVNLARLYQARGQRVPFRILRRAGMTIAVASDMHAAAAAVIRSVLHMVENWGIVTTEAVAARAETLASSVVSVEVARRTLAALPRTCWLDGPDQKWLSLRGRAGHVGIAIRKVFSVSARVQLHELRTALSKAAPALLDVPKKALERYLVEIAGCTVDGTLVRRLNPLPISALSRGEAILVSLVETAGDDIELSVLRRRSLDASLPDTTLGRLLRLSPLVLPGAGDRIRVIGERAPGGGPRCSS